MRTELFYKDEYNRLFHEANHLQKDHEVLYNHLNSFFTTDNIWKKQVQNKKFINYICVLKKI